MMKRPGLVTSLALMVSCGGTTSEPRQEPVLTSRTLLTVVSGDGQLSKPGSRLPQPLVVKATDASGAPLSGVTVTWSVAPGQATVVSASATTGADGQVAANFTTGPTEGIQEATASTSSDTRVVFQSRAIATARPIAFGGRVEFSPLKLWMMNPDGSDMMQVTTLPAWSPAWSPDGKRLAFMIGTSTSCSSVFGDLFVIDFGTVTETRLTQHDNCARVGGPTWSPDGTQIAFLDHANKQIVLIGPDGRGKRVISIANGVDASRPIRVADGLLWYRDGSGLLFFGIGGVWAINADGTGLRQVQFDARYAAVPLAYSPDGATLAGVQQLVPNTVNSRILLGDPLKLDNAQEVSGTSGIFAFAWSPSGAQWFADVYGTTSNPCGLGYPTLVLYDYDNATRKVTERKRFTACGAYAAWRP